MPKLFDQNLTVLFHQQPLWMRHSPGGFFENDVPFEKGFVGVNVPREAEIVQQVLRGDPTQRAILEKILGV